MSPFDRSAARIIAGVLATEHARRTGHAVNYTDSGILDLAEDIVAELATMNGSNSAFDTVIFKDGALGCAIDHGEGDGPLLHKA